jgi:beta-phosphoglucomutase family hydrolase
MNNWAAIFDWDGVIVDSSRAHELSWEQLAHLENRTLPADHFKRSFGMRNEQIFPDILHWTADPTEIKRLALLKEKLYRDIIRQNGIAPIPGVAEFLDQLRATSVPCAIGSSTPRENIDCVMEMIGLRSHFGVIVAGEDVTRGKPNPEVFLLAASGLGVTPERSVVFEDAHVGIEAARAAGMKVVGVATTHLASSLADADRVVQRLNELRLDEIARWF